MRHQIADDESWLERGAYGWSKIPTPNFDRVAGGRRVDDFVSFADLAPTILEATGQPVPAGMSGRSALDVFLSDRSGRIDSRRSWVVGGLEWHGEAAATSLAGRMIRDERYQYIVNYGTTPRQPRVAAKERPDAAFAQSRQTEDERGLVAAHPLHPQVRELAAFFTAARPREELYDLEADPWQTKNLAAAPAPAATKARLKGNLSARPLRSWEIRLNVATADGSERQSVVLPQFYNDQFNTMTFNGQETVAIKEGAASRPLMVPSDPRDPASAQVTLTLAMLRDQNSGYFAALDRESGYISNSQQLGLQTPGVGTNVTGLPISQHQLGFTSLTGGTIVFAGTAEPFSVNGIHPHLAMFTTSASAARVCGRSMARTRSLRANRGRTFPSRIFRRIGFACARIVRRRGLLTNENRFLSPFPSAMRREFSLTL